MVRGNGESLEEGAMSMRYHARSVTFTPIVSQHEVTAAFETETGRVAISMSVRLAADMLQKLEQLDLPRPDAGEVTKLR